MICFRIFWICVLLFKFIRTINSTNSDLQNYVFVVISQSDSYHLKLADEFETNLLNQVNQINENWNPTIYFSHSYFNHIGHWTYFPIFESLENNHQNVSWFIFCEDRTNINLKKLIEVLNKYDPEKPTWLGYGLHDKEPTIIHHFKMPDEKNPFKYPNTASGFAMSFVLLQKINQRMKSDNSFDVDFAIDASHELALYIWDKGNGEPFIFEPTFCVEKKEDCGSYSQKFKQCGSSVPNKSLYFGIKTTEKFHEDRMKYIKETWGKVAVNIGYFSEKFDSTIPTIPLNISNVEHGHCKKTFGIIKYVNDLMETNKNIDWLIIADDDTLLSIPRLQKLLSCYDKSEDIAIGQRYGYSVKTNDGSNEMYGYNYITGGGGMVFSKSIVKLLSNPDICKCPSDTTPDDMFIGSCLQNIGIDIIHSSAFHQARPYDYASEYLLSDESVSFHKFWMLDPISVYNKLFANDDLLSDDNKIIKTEL